MSTSNSIAIWLEDANNNSIDSKIDLHANLWRCKKYVTNVKGKLKEKKNKNKYICDFGIKFTPLNTEQYINIYFPNEDLTYYDIEDLGNHFKNDELSNAVFNEYNDTNSRGTLWVKIKNQKLDLRVRLLEDHDITINNKYKGCILKIKIPKCDGCTDLTKLYIRFRIKNIIDDLFIKKYLPKDSFSKSSFQKIETIDYRVNEKRNIPKSMSEDIKNWPEFETVHFLCLVNSEDELIFSDKSMHSSRSIEKKLWEKYLHPYIFSSLIAYHWKIKKKREINTLIKFQTHSNNWATITKYFLCVVGIALLTNFMYDGLKSQITQGIEWFQSQNSEEASTKNEK